MAKKRDYNAEPVDFCRNAACCSLAIIEEDNMVYCRDCGCTKTERATIDVWEDYYFMAHGEYLITKYGSTK